MTSNGSKTSWIVRAFGRPDGITPVHLKALPLALGLLFAAASLTPSLIPRDALLQGTLMGLVCGIGYLCGRLTVAAWQGLDLPEPTRWRLAILRLVLLAPALLLVIWCLAYVSHWQDTVRAAVTLPPLDASHVPTILALAIVIFCLLLLIGRGIRALFHALRRRVFPFLPARAANAAAAVFAALLVVIVTRDGVIDTAFGVADRAFATGARFFDPEGPPPSDPSTPGGPGSLVDWGALGSEGRGFVTRGPSADDIAALTGTSALDPLRVYVGLEQSTSASERAAIAVAELERVGGFDRDVLVVAMPTGTGWLDEGSHGPMEYLASGDVATISVQYSYLTSPLALIFETDAGLTQSVALTRAVMERWTALDPATRPRLFLHGLSLGAWSSMYSVDLFDMVADPIEGAFWAGPPFPSELWRRAIARRDGDSPYVLPDVDEGRTVQFSNQVQEPRPDAWGAMRLAYLQYASDGIVFFEPASTWREPVWMTEPPAFDVSPHLRWMPVVTVFQLALDMAFATSVPDGFGHNYIARDYIPVWRSLLEPADWDDDAIARLLTLCDTGRGMPCAAPR